MIVDRATQFTLAMMEILERRLLIEWTSDGAPLFISSRVNQFSIQMLRNEYTELCASSSLGDATLDMEICERDHHIIQSTAVGFAEDLDMFAKLGLLLGDRLVLWNTLLQGMLLNSISEYDKISFGKLSCELLLLKPIVIRGGLVILPHPITWLERTRYYFSQVAQETKIGTEIAGLINALALLDEGIRLHPYAMDSDRKKIRLAIDAFFNQHVELSDSALDYHDRLAEFIQNEKLLFLREVSADAFHKFLGPRQYRYKLRSLLSDLPPGETQKEKEEHFKEILNELKVSIDKENKDVLLHKISIGGASVGVAGASIALLKDAVTSAAFITLLTGALGTMARWVPLIEKLITKNKPPTLYQIFYKLEKQAEDEIIEQQTEKWRNIGF